LYDSWGAFDIIEYSSIVAITVAMTFYGMTAGLGLGVICAALTFTLQTSRHVYPIRYVYVYVYVCVGMCMCMCMCMCV
jgi:MFS superfamily sulfate permease-like transporter